MSDIQKIDLLIEQVIKIHLYMCAREYFYMLDVNIEREREK